MLAVRRGRGTDERDRIVTDDDSPQLHVLVETARARVEGLQSKLAEMIGKVRSLRSLEQQLREHVERSAEQRHHERDTLETGEDSIRAGMGALLEQRHRRELHREAEERQQLENLMEQLTSLQRAADGLRGELNQAIAQEKALARRETAMSRERRRLRDEADLDELEMNANLRSFREEQD